MADNSKDVRIGIGIVADTGGADKAAAAIERVADAAETTAKATSNAGTAAGQTAEALTQAGTAASTAAAASNTAAVSVETLAKNFAEANAKSGEWGDTLEKLSSDQLLALEERLIADIRAAQELGQNADQLKEKLRDVYNLRSASLEQSLASVADKATGTAKAAREVEKGLKDAQSTAQGLSNVLSGLSNGGFGGLIQSARGAISIIRQLASGAIGTVLLPAVAVAGVALFAMRKRADELGAATKKTFEDAAKQSDAMKEKLAELEKAAAKSLETQLADVQKLSSGYSELIGRMDEAKQRIAALNQDRAALQDAEIDRDEQRQLSAATTDEDREKISRTFKDRRESVRRTRAVDAIGEGEANARQRLNVAEEAARGVQAQRDRATREAQDAKAAADDALEEAGFAAKEKGAGSPQHEAALRAAKEAAAAAKLAEANLAKLNEELRRTSELIDRDVANARNDLERATVQRATEGTRTEAQQIERRTEAKPKIEKLRADAQSAMERGDFAAQDKAVSELNAIRASVETKTPAVVAAAAEAVGAQAKQNEVVIKILGENRKKIERQSSQISNLRP